MNVVFSNFAKLELEDAIAYYELEHSEVSTLKKKFKKILKG